MSESALTVLVAYASKMGSTAEIAQAIAEELRGQGLEVVCQSFADAPPPDGFDAVVGGSAIYTTRWQKSARRYLKTHRDALAARRVWLFESGPTGEVSQRRHESPAAMVRLAWEIGSPPIMVFGGNLDPARATTAMARWVANSDMAGDYRDWDAIRGWARQIADHLLGRVLD
ncbi:MAG TPA: flavodoxin domain-containing protein [Microlunatus sp.]|nr:flavodoxin domain-containing protein [Microlunatus sp.]